MDSSSPRSPIHLSLCRLDQEAIRQVVWEKTLELVQKTGYRLTEPELYRVMGELVLQQPQEQHPEAEACFRKAIDAARHQQAKSWELRAATSLARLWQGQGKVAEGRELLAPVYEWFTEGFDTADLKEAKALLDTLGEGA